MARTRSTTPLRAPLFALLTLLLAGSPPGTALAQEQAATRLHQVQRQIDSHQEKIEETQIKALNLEQELNRIESQIKKSQETLRELQSKLRRQEKHIQKKEEEIATLRAAKEKSADHVSKRLAAFYQTGEVGIINALFSATDLGELLNLKEYVQALFQYDQRVLQGFRDQLALLAKAKEELTQAQEELKGLIAQVKEGEKALLKSREERDRLLAQARAEEKLYRQALQELTAAAAKLAKTISNTRALELANAKKKLSRQAAKGASRAAASPPSGFAALQGRIPPPAKGRILRGFGPYQDHFGNDLTAAGLDLAVPAATPVTAIHDGRIIFSDQLPGYGKLVIIDHGAQFYSLVSGLETLAQAKGAEVRAGDPLGTFGEPSGLINPGLHVEIRRGATPVDPLLWLDRSQLDM